MASARDVTLQDGRTLQVHDTGAGAAADDRPVLLWHSGSPHTGALLEPLVVATGDRGVRLITYARPGYGRSSPVPGRTVASAASDVRLLADALNLDRFLTMGLSGGGPHALACAALLPDRVAAVASVAGLAPYPADFDWFAGMADNGGPIRAALLGREACERYESTTEFDPESFNGRDYEALVGPLGAVAADATEAMRHGVEGLVEDDLALAAPWGFDLSTISSPVLIVQGGQDRMVPSGHGHWLAEHCSGSKFWFRPDEGHVSILGALPECVDWLLAAWPGSDRLSSERDRA